jgi:hypothetical protein
VGCGTSERFSIYNRMDNARAGDIVDAEPTSEPTTEPGSNVSAPDELIRVLAPSAFHDEACLIIVSIWSLRWSFLL